MKNDLLGECNDQKIPENEFTSIFCKRCKNKSCDRAKWASSTWEERISTQADRFLHNPNIVVQSESSRWEGIVDFELFQAPSTVEVWGVQQPKAPPKVEETPVKIDVVSQERQRVRNDDETPIGINVSDVPAEPVLNVPDSVPTEPLIEPQIKKEPAVKLPKRQMNTAPQEIIIGGLDPAPMPQPKKPVDEWAVPPKKLKIGGTFKMGK